MFKTSFSKYLTAFVLIIFISFFMLAAIITSMIRTYVTDDKAEKLLVAGNIVVDHLVDKEIMDIEAYVHTPMLSTVIESIVNFDSHFNLMIADADGKILLSTATAGALQEDGTKVPVVGGDLGSVSLEFFESGDGDGVVIHNGRLGGILSENSIVCISEVVVAGENRGYVITLASTVGEDRLVSLTRSAVINSSVWVMLAAVIAIYFITERIIHPLRTMTGAAKKFAKGDFSVRVTVYGKDEVSELGKAFNNMAESLDSLEKMRNSFLANVSHDLRTPMTTIAGFIDGITSGAIPAEKHDYYLGVISEEVHRLSRLVSQLLDVSRLESGERKFNFTDFDIAEMSRIVLISFEKKIEDKHLDVSFESEDDEMYAYADKDAVHQVMYNLCHNAIKFAKDCGKFEIKILRTSGKKLRISIMDEGQSISAEDSKRIFERFYKTDESRGLDKSGVGLGLYISKTIIDAHGEEIWVEPVEGEGTEFIFTLPEGAPQQKRKSTFLPTAGE